MNAALSRMSALPAPIAGLSDVAMNLAWSWNRDARELFRRVDPVLWGETRDNPVRLL
jgi:starch phosphorylase